MNIEQASELRNALTIVKGRAQLARQRLRRTNNSNLLVSLELIDSDLAAIDEAVNRVMAVVVELESGIGATNVMAVP